MIGPPPAVITNVYVPEHNSVYKLSTKQKKNRSTISVNLTMTIHNDYCCGYAYTLCRPNNMEAERNLFTIYL